MSVQYVAYFQSRSQQNHKESQNSRTSAAERRNAANLEDAVEFVNLRLAGEQRLLHEELGKDAADRPHVDGRAVLLGTEEQLGRPVPQRHHDRRVVTQRRTVLTRQTKVTDLYQHTVETMCDY